MAFWSSDPSLTSVLTPRQGQALARLEPTQLKYLELLAQGYFNNAIGRELVKNEVEVLENLSQIYKRLVIDMRGDVDPRVAAIRTYLEQTNGS